MKAVIVYESMYGNTHHVASAISVGLASSADVVVVPVHEAVPELIESADLLVVGGPTHVHGMSSGKTRAAAAEAAAKPGSDLELEPDSEGPGLRDWFAGLDRIDARAAAFDTRMSGPPALTGRASKGITHKLRHHGATVVTEPRELPGDEGQPLGRRSAAAGRGVGCSARRARGGDHDGHEGHVAVALPSGDRPVSRGRYAVDAAEAFTVMSGGPTFLAVAGGACLWHTARALRHRRRPPGAALLGVVALAAYLGVIRPWTQRWGATPDEIDAVLPGDELVARPGLSMTRAVTIDAPVEQVWPWLAQIGQDRGGFYSYTWLENLAGCRMHNADRVHPEWQHRSVGDGVPLHPLNGPKLARFDLNQCFAFAGGWYFNLRATDDHRTRLIARTRMPRGLPSLAYAIFVEAPHFIMERKMLLGIKARAERTVVTNLQPTAYGAQMQTTT